MSLLLGMRKEILWVVKTQGFVGLGVVPGFSVAACEGVGGGGAFWGSVGVLTQGSGFFFPCLPRSFRVSMIGVIKRGRRRR